jgi:hypothetical protein
VAVFFSLANYRQISTFFEGHPPVKWKKRGGWGGRRIIQIFWKTRNGKMLWARKLGYDMVESSPDTLSGCRLFTWRIVDLT